MGRLVMTSESCGVVRRRLELGRRRSGCALGRVVTSAAIVDFVLEETVLRAPFEGIGKPEPLKGELSGYWSRRINDEHRLVYTRQGR